MVKWLSFTMVKWLSFSWWYSLWFSEPQHLPRIFSTPILGDFPHQQNREATSPAPSFMRPGGCPQLQRFVWTRREHPFWWFKTSFPIFFFLPYLVTSSTIFGRRIGFVRRAGHLAGRSQRPKVGGLIWALLPKLDPCLDHDLWGRP